ncbi:uncharacterized protein LOC115541880 [Gadus morhua]|uniref:uncharacterized protein LOC115541880 n=1 Tax=Gadus morhua TaxID=8049 RepID=UPI0011B5975E|nr:uncharacterized protein LOC115541880 [Gadus morhua]
MELAGTSNVSVHTRKSKSSSSSTSSAAVRARAKAEAAKARATFAVREVTLKVQKAEKEAELQLGKAKLEAELSALALQREAAAAIAQAEALEAAELDIGDSIRTDPSSLDLQNEIATRTNEYVEAQAGLDVSLTRVSVHTTSPGVALSDASYVTWPPPPEHNSEPQGEIKEDETPYRPSRHDATPRQPFPSAKSRYVTHISAPLNGGHTNQERRDGQQTTNIGDNGHHTTPARGNGQPTKPKTTHHPHKSPFKATAPSYVPMYAPPTASVAPETEHLARYLARRDLVSTSLYQFDDKPENYLAWQSSFSNATTGLGLTTTEMLDLLIKWLGTESVKHIKRIRSVYVGNPDVALKKAWDRLQECYAAPEVMEEALFKRLDEFPRISTKDYGKLRDLGDLLMELQGAREEGYLTGLTYLDTARGIGPIVEKLPYGLQEKWLTVGSRFKEENNGHFPPFDYFADFICHEARRRNDPSFILSCASSNGLKSDKVASNSYGRKISVHKTDISPGKDPPANSPERKPDGPEKNCPIHNKPHALRKCRTFRGKVLEERKSLLKEHGICFKCCTSASHLARDCKVKVKCAECDSDRHHAAMHPGPPPQVFRRPTPPSDNGGEEEEHNSDSTAISSHCTQVCGPGRTARSCAKICLVRVYPQGQREKAVNMYVILDDQSNRSLVRSDFFQLFNIKGQPFPYSLKTCAGLVETSGRKAEGFQVESLDGQTSLQLPSLIECNDILIDRSEIPTPDAACHHPHLRSVAPHLPELDPKAEILILLGRDIVRVHKVRQQVSGPHNAPFAQRLDLGWVIVGDVCLGNAHRPAVGTFKTNVLENGRPTFLKPCKGFMKLTEDMSQGGAQKNPPHKTSLESLGLQVFNETDSDNKPAPSFEDIIFLEIMEREMYRGTSNNWVAPLPFRVPRQRLSNNREQVFTRFTSLEKTLRRKPEMRGQFVEFMKKIFDNGHAEVAPPLEENEEGWYLPTFGVYHPQKPGSIRVVFDSSAKYFGTSLNDVFLTGPDLNNSLIGVLIRFRKEQVAVIADIQQMFHCFLVRKDHRNYLRFLWYRDNDMSKDIVDYRMTVHVFGNSPSPSVAIYGLRRAIHEGAHKHGEDTVQFVERHFYVDDGLISVPTEAEAISLLQRTQTSLSESNLRLHKFASNREAVLQAFAPEDRAVLKDLDLSGEATPVQRSLGLLWETTTDTFTFAVSEHKKAFTRRGVLSTVNSVFDPLGMVAPVTIEGKSLLRGLSVDTCDWDAPLPEQKLKQWEAWRESLHDLSKLHIPRAYTATSLSNAEHTELCVFSDASTKAIGAVAYLRTIQAEGQVEVGFILGKAKLAPQSEPTIPRLELCAAVLAVEVAELIQDELDTKLNTIKFFCDSKVVLGYIHNQTKRFYVYVHNRVRRIRQSTKPDQWFYVNTEDNPADHASRSVPASKLTQTTWFTGPAFLHKQRLPEEETSQTFGLVNPESDSDIRPEVCSFLTQTQTQGLSAERFQRFSSMCSLTRAIALLIHIARAYRHSTSSDCKGWHHCSLPRTPDELAQARHIVIRAAQEDVFTKELTALELGRAVTKDSSIQKLRPILEGDLIRVGGRLKHADLSNPEKNPIILPKNSQVSLLLVRQYHEDVKHQGRHLTEGALRAAGFWVIGGKGLIASVLHKCVVCRRLRRRTEVQLMADLPQERLHTCPPFTYVGVDVFGPWQVISRRTRGGQAQSKRWAMLFCCMSSRAVHIEIIDSMDTSSCINALRRFFAIRGPAKQIRSDCGTNFVAAARELGMSKQQPDSTVQNFLSQQGCSWVFNPPHASHMGGSWERMIGLSRRILDAILLQENIQLTHDVLCTLMMEVSAIINARPLVPVSTDPESPFILSPAMILTQKIGVTPPHGDFTDKDLLSRQWRQVQALADRFWRRWRQEFLPTLQARRKWRDSHRDLKEGDIVLLKDNQAARNVWPMAMITAVFPGKDSKVRKVELRTSDQGSPKVFLRPVSEVVLLLPKDCS